MADLRRAIRDRHYEKAVLLTHDVEKAIRDLRHAKLSLRAACASLVGAPVRSVATACGLAPATVSSLFYGHLSITPENIRRVLEEARKQEATNG